MQYRDFNKCICNNTWVLFFEDLFRVIPNFGYHAPHLTAFSDSFRGFVSELPTCLLCVCLTGSVYCEEILIDVVPTLPKETAYLYARYNKIKRINTKDFANFRK